MKISRCHLCPVVIAAGNLFLLIVVDRLDRVPAPNHQVVVEVRRIENAIGPGRSDDVGLDLLVIIRRRDRDVFAQQRLVIEGRCGLREFVGIAQQLIDFALVETQRLGVRDLAALVRADHRLADMGDLDMKPAVLVERSHGVSIECQHRVLRVLRLGLFLGGPLQESIAQSLPVFGLHVVGHAQPILERLRDGRVKRPRQLVERRPGVAAVLGIELRHELGGDGLRESVECHAGRRDALVEHLLFAGGHVADFFLGLAIGREAWRLALFGFAAWERPVRAVVRLGRGSVQQQNIAVGRHEKNARGVTLGRLDIGILRGPAAEACGDSRVRRGREGGGHGHVA